MNSGLQSIFKKVAVSERKNIFRSLAEAKEQIIVKRADSEQSCHLVAVQIEKDESLFCHHTDDSKELLQNQMPVVVNFMKGNERYYLSTEVKIQSGWVILSIQGDLFQLQRRSNVRFDLPAQYPASFIITGFQQKNLFITCPLKDISAGGFRMEVPELHPDFQTGDIMLGSLRLGGRRPLEFEVEVRFKAISPEGTKQIMGVQFLNVDQTLENRLLNLMMDLQREVFLKFPQLKGNK